MRDEWREAQERLLRGIEHCQTAGDACMDESVRLLELVKDAHRLFEKQLPGKNPRQLNFLLSNYS